MDGGFAKVGGGLYNTASGSGATVGGGDHNTASKFFATVPGGHGAVASHYGEMAYASGTFTPTIGGTVEHILKVASHWRQ